MRIIHTTLGGNDITGMTPTEIKIIEDQENKASFEKCKKLNSCKCIEKGQFNMGYHPEL